MAGIILVLLGLFKLGVVIKFIPYPIIVGFTAGIALTIFSTQIKDLFGLRIDGAVPEDFIGKWAVYFQHFDTTNLWALGIGLVSILIILLTPKVSRKIPGSLAAIILVTVASLPAQKVLRHRYDRDHRRPLQHQPRHTGPRRVLPSI